MLKSVMSKYLFILSAALSVLTFITIRVLCHKTNWNIKALRNATIGLSEEDKFSIAYVTVPNIVVAKNIAQDLLKQKLVASAIMIPQVTSFYTYVGDINEDSKSLLMIKTRASHIDKLTEYLCSNHDPYEMCDVVSLAIENGDPLYLNWIKDNVPEKILLT